MENTKLVNIGNTCAINSLIQSLSRFNINLFDKLDEKSFTFSLIELLNLMNSNPGKTIRPNKFIKKLYTHLKTFKQNQQLDVQELWILLSNKIFEETAIPYNNINIKTNYIHKTAFDQLNLHNNYKKSEWDNVFQGSIINILTCTICSNKSFKFEPFYSLSMNINNSIINILKDYFKKEYIHDVDCIKCKQKTLHVKNIKFYKIPKIFVISINRYNNTCEKQNDKIQINRSIILGNTILFENTKNIELNLISTINHFGNLNNGHYNSLDVINNTIIDDTNIIAVNNDIYNNNQNIYMLFYKS